MAVIPILTYHSIDDSGSPVSLSRAKFREHMRHLSKAAIKVLSLEEAAGYIREGRPLPPKSAVITFDDGYKNFYESAWPVLKEHGFIATVFLVTGLVGKTNKWDAGSKDIPSLPLLSWDEIAEMAAAGIDFGAHTINHIDLSKATPEEAQAELVGSKRAILRYLGNEPKSLAYPFGRFSDEAVKIAKENFLLACTTKRGVAGPESDVHLLPRVETLHFADNDRFKLVGTPLLLPYLKALKIKRFMFG